MKWDSDEQDAIKYLNSELGDLLPKGRLYEDDTFAMNEDGPYE